MKGSDYAVLVSTFVMGMFAGFFFYVTVFAPTYSTELDVEEFDSQTVIIEGQMYGGCERQGSCASFRLEDDRTYRYFETSDADVVEEKLPREIADDVFDVIGTEDFFTASESITQEMCNSFGDGIDYRYEVYFDEESYTLDTCTSALSYDEFLQRTFLQVWAYMDNPTTTYPVIIEKGIGGFFIDRFQNSAQE